MFIKTLFWGEAISYPQIFFLAGGVFETITPARSKSNFTHGIER